MKKVALDLGDRWIGVAISDPLGIIARPYDTIPAGQLIKFIAQLLEIEKIDTIIVGHPRTLRGTNSEQTNKVVAEFNRLAKRFPSVQWSLFDERLTSKQAATLNTKKSTDKRSIKKSMDGARSVHALAAALLLTTYLTYLISRAPEIEE